jgi:hypothetical protein
MKPRVNLLIALALLGTTTLVPAQALYEQTFASTSPGTGDGTFADLGWAGSGSIGWSGYYRNRTAGTYLNSADASAISGNPLFMGNGSGVNLMATYTTDSMGAGSYGSSAFADISLSANPTLLFSVFTQWYPGWGTANANITGYFLVQNGGNWYASATAITPPTSYDPNSPAGGWNSSSYGNFDPRSVVLTAGAVNWIIVSGIGTGTITLGSAATSDLSGNITGAGLLINADNSGGTGGSWNFGDFKIEAVPEPGTMALLALGGLAMILRRRHV